jgi:hypothetical protein
VQYHTASPVVREYSVRCPSDVRCESNNSQFPQEVKFGGFESRRDLGFAIRSIGQFSASHMFARDRQCAVARETRVLRCQSIVVLNASEDGEGYEPSVLWWRLLQVNVGFGDGMCRL